MLAAVEIADLQTLKQPVKLCLPTHSLSLSLSHSPRISWSLTDHLMQLFAWPQKDTNKTAALFSAICSVVTGTRPKIIKMPKKFK